MQAQHGSLRHCHILLTATTVQIISNTWEETHTHTHPNFYFPYENAFKVIYAKKSNSDPYRTI